MGYFKELRTQDGGGPEVPSAEGRISHDPRLIDTLLRDHAELGRLYGRIGAAVEAGNFDEVRSFLTTFKSRLDAHLLTENLRFYNYLEQSLADDPGSARMVREFRHEMNDIAHAVVTFIKQYQASDFSPVDRQRFALDYEAVGRKLEHRLDCEEDSLYRLYRPC